tara:strand:- start:19597 stop:20601 length:1005 start_codon:yes stop_codon:yes gene_type:complete
MTEKTLNMEMANLVCRFGSKKVLLDLEEEVVLPSFFDDSLIREYDKTSYFFYDVKAVKLEDKGEVFVGLAGRFIKDTTLEREQIFDRKNGLVQDSNSMKSSPSAIFLLILNNHRLIYVKETKNAPSKETFRSTLLSFLRVKHKQFVESEYLKNKEDPENNITKKSLYEAYPKPTLELISLTSDDSIESFVRNYETLKHIEISLSDRNDETDNDPFFEQLQKRKDDLGSDKSVVQHRNSKGLDKEKAIAEIREATAQGNQKVKLNGVDSDGDVLRGNNEEFQLRRPLEELSKLPSKAAEQLYETFKSLIDDGFVKVPSTSEKAKDIVKKIAGRFF